jgi:hypothetical protein
MSTRIPYREEKQDADTSCFSFLARSVLRYIFFIICYYLLLTHMHWIFPVTEDVTDG